MVITAVARANPTRPDVSCAMTIDSRAFTATLPRSRVHSRRLPSARTGWIFCTDIYTGTRQNEGVDWCTFDVVCTQWCEPTQLSYV